MKRRLIALLLLGCLIMTGCSSRLRSMNAHAYRSGTASNAALDTLVAALNARDAAALKALFSVNAQNAADLDTPIQTLLALTEGHNVSYYWNGINSSGETRHDGKTTEFATIPFFDLYIGETPYTGYLYLHYRCDADPDAVGVTSLMIVSDYVYAGEDFIWLTAPGLHINVATGTDYETRRVKGKAYHWTEYDRTITEAELRAVIEATGTIEGVREAFGPANNDTIWDIYQLADENGEPRYALLSVGLDGSCSSLSIADDVTMIPSKQEGNSLPEPTP